MRLKRASYNLNDNDILILRDILAHYKSNGSYDESYVRLLCKYITSRELILDYSSNSMIRALLRDYDISGLDSESRYFILKLLSLSNIGGS